MPPLDFLIYAVENWVTILLWTFFFIILLYYGTKKFAVAGVFDPIHFTYTFTMGTKYALVFALYFNGLISDYLFFMVAMFGIAFYLSFFYSSMIKQPTVNKLFSLLVPKNNNHFEFKIILLIYLVTAIYIISNIGFGFFASTNRFDNNQGYGAFVRITDALGTFIIAYLGIVVYKRYKNIERNDFRQYLSYLLLFIFIIFFTILNGAKAAFVFAIMTIILAIRAKGYKFNIGYVKGIVILSVATIVAMLGLYINLVNNEVETSGEGKLVGAPVVVEQFVARIAANGNQSYMSLPNDIIDKIQTDSIFIRLATPLIGSSTISKIIGYNSSDYSVGRQILLYYDPNTDVAGGPTSHFDLFSYAYLGYGGIFFVVLLGYILGSINKLLKTSETKSIFYTSLITTLWIRSMAIILEPPTGLGYVFDIFIIFMLLHIFIIILNAISFKGELYVHR